MSVGLSLCQRMYLPACLLYKVGKKVANLVHRKSILYARMPIFVCKVGRIETNLVHYYTKGGGQ